MSNTSIRIKSRVTDEELLREFVSIQIFLRVSSKSADGRECPFSHFSVLWVCDCSNEVDEEMRKRGGETNCCESAVVRVLDHWLGGVTNGSSPSVRFMRVH